MIEEICCSADTLGVLIVEDTAESLGAMVNGVQTSTFDDYGIMFFNGKS